MTPDTLFGLVSLNLLALGILGLWASIRRSRYFQREFPKPPTWSPK
jgi:hypothetical protein